MNGSFLKAVPPNTLILDLFAHDVDGSLVGRPSKYHEPQVVTEDQQCLPNPSTHCSRSMASRPTVFTSKGSRLVPHRRSAISMCSLLPSNISLHLVSASPISPSATLCRCLLVCCIPLHRIDTASCSTKRADSCQDCQCPSRRLIRCADPVILCLRNIHIGR